MRKFNAVILFIFLSISNIAHARWANYQDASIEFEFYNRDVTVNADGSSTEIVEVQAKILKESGRSIWANYPLRYNSNISDINIIEAKTIYNGSDYKLTTDLIEDKPLASSPSGFDQLHQITLAYPNAEVGASLYLKYKYTIKSSELPNFYSTNFVYGTEAYWKKSTVKLHSEIPLYIAVNDPDNVLQVTKNSQEPFTDMTIELKNPTYRSLIEEGFLLDYKKLPWITVSSMNDWNAFAIEAGKPYATVLSQKLPNTLQQIAEAAKKKTSNVNIMNYVTSQLAEKIQYMGDWKTVDGRLKPHDLDHIAKLQLGDCKDFTVSAGAILQHLGFKVQPVLVMRGEIVFYPPDSLPNFAHQNHVFTKVTDNAGNVYWVDPTNFVSMANGIFPDIANKEVLIIDPKEPGLARTPPTDPDKMQTILKQQWDLSTPDTILAKGSISLLNEAAIDFSGAHLRYSREAIDNIIFGFVGDDHRDAVKDIQTPDLSSRIVRDLEFKFSYKQDNIPLKTNLGPGIKLPLSSRVSSFIRVKPDQESDLYVGPTNTLKVETRIKNFKVESVQSLNISIKTRWLDVTRRVKADGSHVTIIDRLRVKQSLIKNHELKSKEYLELKDYLERNFTGSVLIGKY